PSGPKREHHCGSQPVERHVPATNREPLDGLERRRADFPNQESLDETEPQRSLGEPARRVPARVEPVPDDCLIASDAAEAEVVEPGEEEAVLSPGQAQAWIERTFDVLECGKAHKRTVGAECAGWLSRRAVHLIEDAGPVRPGAGAALERSEERRVGKEWSSRES